MTSEPGGDRRSPGGAVQAATVAGRERYLVAPAVDVALVHDGHVLLLRRCGSGWQDGNYSVVAGHVEEGERPEDTAVREVAEETGLHVAVDDLACFHVMYRRAAHGVWVDFFFACRAWTGTPVLMEPDRADRLLWAPLDALPHNMVPHARTGLSLLESAGGEAPAYSTFGF